MPLNSRQKGARGERELAEFLRDAGFSARRGQQFIGGANSPDVISDIDTVHWEVKRVEERASGSLHDWLDQAITDSAGKKMPIVAHKRNRREWIAIMRMSDLLILLKEGKCFQSIQS